MVTVEDSRVVVQPLHKRAHNPLLKASRLADGATPMPWFGGKQLLIRFSLLRCPMSFMWEVKVVPWKLRLVWSATNLGNRHLVLSGGQVIRQFQEFADFIGRKELFHGVAAEDRQGRFVQVGLDQLPFFEKHFLHRTQEANLIGIVVMGGNVALECPLYLLAIVRKGVQRQGDGRGRRGSYPP